MLNLKLKEKVLESLAAVLPITGIVFLISLFFVPVDLGKVSLFLTGSVLLIIGMGFFQLGAEMSMTPIGEGIGVQISKTKKNTKIFKIYFFPLFNQINKKTQI